MKIAIASSGLGVVTRGIETWALETALALHAAGIDVTLYTGGELPAGTTTGDLPVVTLAKCPRTGNKAQFLARWTPGPLWRLGLKSGYGWEQACFWWSLRKHLNRSHADILHVQDPMVAWWNLWGRKHGRVTALEILAHGTEEPLTFLQKFPRLQHLAPWTSSIVRPMLFCSSCFATARLCATASRDLRVPSLRVSVIGIVLLYQHICRVCGSGLDEARLMAA